MPLETKRAMRDAIEVNSIIVGGYTDRDGGVCPMLAAHRHGGRTSFASFARAWDKYTRAGNTPRRASEREVRTLKTMLDASIAIDDVQGGMVLGDAIADHRQVQVERALREEHADVPLNLEDLLDQAAPARDEREQLASRQRLRAGEFLHRV